MMMMMMMMFNTGPYRH